MRTIVVLAYEGAALLDIAGLAQAFGAASTRACDAQLVPSYEIKIASIGGGAIRTSTGVDLASVPLTCLAAHTVDTLIVCGGGEWMARKDRAWLLDQSESCRRIAGVSAGVLALAAAGVLDGRRITTHWSMCGALQTCYPKVEVEADAIFVRDGKVWTSAGATAGIDMALAMIEEDLGRATSLDVARDLVLFQKRAGGQPQESAVLQGQRIGDDNLRRLIEWIVENPSANLNTETLADKAQMSLRTLFRAFGEYLQTTPREFVEAVRLEAACRRLEQTSESIALVSRKAGFSSAEAMRRAFDRRFCLTPSEYRDRASNSSRDTAAGPFFAAGAIAQPEFRR
ncbi:MAG: helix-turn-helix domain-containing protein [Alphaproteobacteria bacterium]